MHSMGNAGALGMGDNSPSNNSNGSGSSSIISGDISDYAKPADAQAQASGIDQQTSGHGHDLQPHAATPENSPEQLSTASDSTSNARSPSAGDNNLPGPASSSRSVSNDQSSTTSSGSSLDTPATGSETAAVTPKAPPRSSTLRLQIRVATALLLIPIIVGVLRLITALLDVAQTGAQSNVMGTS